MKHESISASLDDLSSLRFGFSNLRTKPKINSGRRTVPFGLSHSSTTNDIIFLYDGWNLLAELNNSNPGSGIPILRSYTWGTDLGGTFDGAAGIGGLTMFTDSSTGTNYNHFAAFDGNGNLACLVKNDITITARYEYSPYGELIRATGPLSRVIPFRWSTKFFDEESGLVYYGNRYYSSTCGRWVGRDLIDERKAVSPYAFCLNRPTQGVDPDGRTFLDPLGIGQPTELEMYRLAGNIRDAWRTLEDGSVSAGSQLYAFSKSVLDDSLRDFNRISIGLAGGAGLATRLGLIGNMSVSSLLAGGEGLIAGGALAGAGIVVGSSIAVAGMGSAIGYGLYHVPGVNQLVDAVADVIVDYWSDPL